VVIVYKLRIRDQAGTGTVWLDAATHLPLKRSLRLNMGGVAVFTETYRDFHLNPPLDARTFELPNTKGDPK
jgi:outer membrane lipoprotein-sorting protein